MSTLESKRIEDITATQCGGESLRRRAHALIPGGAHTYAKGDDQYPESAPPFLVRGSGCHVWDVDGRSYIEYGMGLRSVTLGHAYPPVVRAAQEQMLLGCNFCRPSPLEVECAETLRQLIDSAEMIKFAKNGSDATSAAVRLARAYTGREIVAVCADQPFFSVDDWFIGITPMNAGIPPAVSQSTVTFRYNDLDSVRQLFQQYPDQIACLMMEAATYEEPTADFLPQVQRLCQEHGTLFVLDEMITGFRWHNGGAQAVYGIQPDLSTFGKALGNGFAVAALTGRREVMRLGGLDHDQPRVFLLSYTHGAELHGLAAALETMRAYQQLPVVETLYRQGTRLRAGVERAVADLGLASHFQLQGRPCSLIFVTRDAGGERSQMFRTLFMQELIRRGVIAPSLVVSFAHTDDDIDATISAITESLKVYRLALADGVDRYLEGRPTRPVFRKFNG